QRVDYLGARTKANLIADAKGLLITLTDTPAYLLPPPEGDRLLSAAAGWNSLPAQIALGGAEDEAPLLALMTGEWPQEARPPRGSVTLREVRLLDGNAHPNDTLLTTNLLPERALRLGGP